MSDMLTQEQAEGVEMIAYLTAWAEEYERASEDMRYGSYIREVQAFRAKMLRRAIANLPHREAAHD